MILDGWFTKMDVVAFCVAIGGLLLCGLVYLIRRVL